MKRLRAWASQCSLKISVLGCFDVDYGLIATVGTDTFLGSLKSLRMNTKQILTTFVLLIYSRCVEVFLPTTFATFSFNSQIERSSCN